MSKSIFELRVSQNTLGKKITFHSNPRVSFMQPGDLPPCQLADQFLSSMHNKRPPNSQDCTSCSCQRINCIEKVSCPLALKREGTSNEIEDNKFGIDHIFFFFCIEHM